MESARLVRLARRQLGLFTRAQALACGFSYRQISRRVDVGEWITAYGPVLALAAVEMTAKVKDRALQLALPGSVLAGPSAARYWGIDLSDSQTYLYATRRRGTAPADATVLHPLPQRRDIGSADGCPITSRALTVVDCLRVLPEPRAIDLLDRALQQGWLTLADLSERSRGLVGHKGAPRLRRLLRQAVSGTRSAAERLLARLLVHAGITGWTANTAISDRCGLIGMGDVVFARTKLVLECDGWAFHCTPDQFQRDRRRQNRLVAAGWTVLRFTWRDLTGQPEQTITTIRTILAKLELGLR